MKVLLTGQPGVGKTTLIRSLAEEVGKAGLGATGFYTNEIRQSGTRIGFDITSLSSQESRPLAREHTPIKGPKVGKYTVLLSDFEAVAIPCLRDARPGEVLFIDEIGKWFLH